MKEQFLKFSLVGVAATVTTCAVLILLVEVLHWGAVPASVAGYLAGAGLNYGLNYRFTFNSTQRHQVAIPRFLVIMAVGLALNSGIMFIAVNRLDIHYLLGQLIAIAIVLAWSFTMNRLWTFGQ